jgi:hypothetical protein
MAKDRSSHSTARRVLTVLSILIERLDISEDALMQEMEQKAGQPLPPNTLRKYIRTIRHAGFALDRKRPRGIATYTFRDTAFHWSPRASYGQAFEAFMCSLPERSTAFQKWIMLVDPLHRHTCPTQKKGKGSVHSLTSYTRQALLDTIRQGIQHEQVLEFHLDGPLTTQHPGGILWAIPFSITIISPRHIILTCLTPYSKRLFYMQLNNIFHATITPDAWMSPFWKHNLSYILCLSPKLAKRYDIKAHERAEVDLASDALRLHVTDEALPVALSRTLKYGHLATVEKCPPLESVMRRFEDLQATLFESSKAFWQV